ncbi:VWA domain-containing protein [Niastella caeni]|uniref:VWA domain-containing protein n=1 Tax=Niastella caeni TaxID=2569763 RepID=A0A4S8HEZ4_9BACT|nr:VWA domain-containing protein [Niastella caeni]THU33473.1 VWA domain-containing protein [Niastella caeni]
MKSAAAILTSFLFIISAHAQYYLRGEVRDEKNNLLSNARIVLHSTNYIYSSGSSGSFGIMTTKRIDSITISLDGYQSLSVKLETAKYHSLVLKTLFTSANLQKNRLLSFTRNLKPGERRNWTVGTETYNSLLENDFVQADKYPETGFSINTDKASYSNVRRFLNMNTTVPPDAVRTEELLNYFSFKYLAPPRDSIFGFHSYVTECPWNKTNQLLSLHISARKLDPEKIPPSNLVFLIDVSGSMDMPNRLPLLKSAFTLLVNNLRDKDTISIVVYGSTIGVWLQPTSGKEKEKIRKSIEELYPGGSTPGESGIRTAYTVAKSQFIKGGNNRVILATDGDFNVGQTSDDELEKLITLHQQSGIYLTCLGVGMGNYKDSKLEVLAKKGNGNFAYLDNEREAEKVLVKELTQTLYSVADNAFLNIEFNPDVVKQYRLIGFDNKWKALVDSVNDLDGGEVGSGHSMIALFEIDPVFTAGLPAANNANLAKINVRYKLPNDTLQRITSYRCLYAVTPFNSLPSTYRFASSVAMFAALLKDSKYARTYSWSEVIKLASESADEQDAIQQEFITNIEKAKKIYGRERKRKKSN